MKRLVLPLIAALALVAAAPAAEARTVARGTLASVGSEYGRGTVTIRQARGRRTLKTSSTFYQRAVRIQIWLSTSKGGKKHVNLGAASLSGAQTFRIPKGVSLRKYRYVIVWCVKYSVQISRAKLRLA
jgi:hypothetical protein